MRNKQKLRPLLEKVFGEEVIVHPMSSDEDKCTFEARVLVRTRDADGNVWEGNRVIRIKLRKKKSQPVPIGGTTTK